MPYNVNFISGHPVKLPGVPRSKKNEIAPLLKGKGHLIDYSHHSVVMNKKRKFAFFSASNVDGIEWKKLKRKGNFRKDENAILSGYQLGNELYNAIKKNGSRPNDFEQGHLTSFQEVLWGKTRAEIQQAANDTFYFTNCVPQHERLNVGLWRSLEQYVLKTQTVHHNLKVTVITGPVLSENDPWYIKKIDGQQVKIPCAFWKIIYYPNHKGLNAVGFMMSQKKLLLKDGTVTYQPTATRAMAQPLPMDNFFMDYKHDSVYQVRVEFIQEITSIRFMLNKVHLPYQVKTKTNLIFKRIEVPSGRVLHQRTRPLLNLIINLME